MRKTEYDFLSWTSFPSSAKLLNDESSDWASWMGNVVPVSPGSKVKLQAAAKQEGVLNAREPSHVHVDAYDGTKWASLFPLFLNLPLGSFDWATFSCQATIPLNIVAIRCSLAGGGSGTPGKPGITWFDDLKVYQDDVLIYSNDFAKWDPVIGAGLGAGVLGVVVPAVVRVPEPGVAYEYQKPVLEKEPLWAAGLAGLGALVGGGIGLLTSLGIVPVPQIPPLPALEAPPEGARLGTYVVRG